MTGLLIKADAIKSKLFLAGRGAVKTAKPQRTLAHLE